MGGALKITRKAQVSIDFALAFIVALLFLVLVTRLFVWFCSTIVNRHVAFEQTRNATVITGVIITTPTGPHLGDPLPPPVNFYNQSTAGNKLKIFP
jgi:hypothetical protein